MKIGIIGCGHVGSTLAFYLAGKNMFSDFILIDEDKNKALRTAYDLNQATPILGAASISSGGYENLIDADIVVVTAGFNRRTEEESRFDLSAKNFVIVKEITEKIVERNTNCIIIIATNPVDIMTYVAFKVSGFPQERVIGLGTLIDTVRMKYYIGQKLKLNPKDINLLIIGEHGDKMIPLFSSASVSGIPLGKTVGFDDLAKKEVVEKTKKSGEKIISLGSSPSYAPAVAAATLIEAIVYNTRQILPVTSYILDTYDIFNICLSLPTRIGSSGITEKIIPQLLDDELIALHESYQRLQMELDKLLAS